MTIMPMTKIQRIVHKIKFYWYCRAIIWQKFISQLPM